MKKLLAVTVVMVFVLGLAGIAGASPAMTEGTTGLDASPHFEETDWGYSADGENTGSPRFSDGGGIGVDSQGGLAVEEASEEAEENSVVSTTLHDHTRIEPCGLQD